MGHVVYFGIAASVFMAGLFAADDEHDIWDSQLWMFAAIWPLSLFILCVYLLIRASGMMEAERKQQKRKAAQREAKG